MKLNETFKHIISNPKLDHFTAVEIRTAYLVLSQQCNFNNSEARRFVYAELVKLVKKGWLKKRVSQKKGITSYVKTDLFNIKYTPQDLPTTSIKLKKVKTENVNNTKISKDLLCRLQRVN